jgi:hypothetical protein
MDSLELNKIVAAVLTAGVVAMTAGFIGELLVKPHELEENVYQVVLSEGTAGGAEAAAAPTLEAVGPLLRARASAPPATPSRKVAPKRSGPTCGTSWTARSRAMETSPIPTP